MTAPETSAQSATEDLRIGVIGLGSRSALGRHAHRPGEGSRVVAVCDLDPEALARARERYGDEVRTTTDHRDLLDGSVDAVLLVTPDDAHEDLAVDILTAGVPVYVEKPLTITVEGCDRVLAAAREHGARLYVGHNMRHMPMVLLLRDLILRGEIGEVKAVWCRHFVGNGGDYYFKDWHAERARTTGLLLQKAAHDIDVIHWLAGGYTRRVTGMGALTLYGDITDRADNRGRLMKDWFSYDNWPPLSQRGLHPVIDVEDLSMISMALDNGVLASYEQCHYTPDYWRNYTVIGTEGRIENFGDTGGKGVVRLWNKRTDYNPDGDATFPIPGSSEGHGGADASIIAEFLRFVRVGGATATSPVAARESVATGVTATESLRNGSIPLDVPTLDPALHDYFEAGQQAEVTSH
jgi:predicted dehydrogenase